eukprot:826988_1
MDFFKERASKCQGDIVSIVMHDHEAIVIKKREPLTESMGDELVKYPPRGGNDFILAMRTVKGLTQPDDNLTVLFLSDGQWTTAVDVVREIQAVTPDFQMHTVQFADSSSVAHKVLREMAAVTPEGSFKHCKDGLSLSEHFGALTAMGT